MVRYLALSGEAGAVRECLRRHVPKPVEPHRLNRIFDRPGLVIFASPETPIVRFEDGTGVMIGRLFRNDGPGVKTVGPVHSKAVRQSEGRFLLREYWGQYVAFIRDGDRLAIVRDPSAAVPAYVHGCGDLRIICSSLELAGGLTERPQVDEGFARLWLRSPFLRTSRTGLAGWREIPPGTSLGSDGSIQLLWDAGRRAGLGPRPPSFDQAAKRVRDAVLFSVPRMVEDLPRPVLELSGGLDSSIVAASLHAAGITFEAVNFVTRMPDGDERHYASIVAQHSGVELTELAEDDLPLTLEPPQSPGPRPPPSPVLQPLERARRAFALGHPGTTFVTGAGGDNIFCYLGTAAPIVDAFRAMGARAALETSVDVAESSECTIFKALGFAIRKACGRHGWGRWPTDERFLPKDLAGPEAEEHPWTGLAAGNLPGSIEHLRSLIRAQHFLEPRYDLGDPAVHPLLNQPLIEACLSIPSWLWVKGGHNRSVARAAFAGLLPEEIVERRTKGRLESMCARAYRSNRLKLAALLLDGELARRRVIDRRAVEHYLAFDGEPRDDDYFRIFDLASLELWLRAWAR